MVGVDDSSLWQNHNSCQLAWSEGRQMTVTVLQSWYELDKRMQWCNIINVDNNITITIISTIITNTIIIIARSHNFPSNL